MQYPYATAVFRAPSDRTTKAYVKNSFSHGRGYALSSFRHQRSVVVSAPVQDTAGSPQRQAVSSNSLRLGEPCLLSSLTSDSVDTFVCKYTRYVCVRVNKYV